MFMSLFFLCIRRNHAQRTATLASIEAQIQVLNNELSVKDKTVKETIERLAVLQTRIAGSEGRLEERIIASTAEKEQLEKSASQERQKYIDTLEEMKSNHDNALEAIKRDFAKKSSLARTLLSEK